MSCPEGMIEIGDSCVDTYEAPNQKGAKPLIMFSAHEAEEWCGSRSKRLCRIEEWVRACEGTYEEPLKPLPVGVMEAPGKCNNDKSWRLPNEYALARLGKETGLKEAERLWQGEPSGSRPDCKSKTGVYDTIGNVEEWVSSPKDRHGYALMGHYWSRASKNGCRARVTDHAPVFFFYTTGFRCCSDLTSTVALATEMKSKP